MAAVTIASFNFLDINVASPRVEIKYFVTDPAAQNDGSGHDATMGSVVAILDPLDPFNWDTAMRDAVVNDAANLQPPHQPFTVTNARCLMPVYSDALLKDQEQFATPVDGFNITVNQNSNALTLAPAGTLASGTVNFPNNSKNGRTVNIASSQTITALTLNPGTGQSFNPGAALTTIAANSFAWYRMHDNVWYRVG